MVTNTGKASRRILPGRATMSFLVIPGLVRWGIGFGLGGWFASMAAVDAEGVTSPGRIILAFLPLGIMMVLGFVVGNIVRSILLGILLESLKGRGDLGRALCMAGSKFDTAADTGNNGLVCPRATRAAREAGLAEADLIVAELDRGGEATPMLWWRAIRWCEAFGDAANRLFPYDRHSNQRLEKGWWANQMLPGNFTDAKVSSMRQSVIAALPYADPEEGCMLGAFLAEAQALTGSTLSGDDKAELYSMVEQAKRLADGIVGESRRMPSIGDPGSLLRMKRILAEDGSASGKDV